MSSRDHLVVHEFLFAAEMATEAFFRALHQIARVNHSQRDGLLVGPIAFRVRTEPPGRGAVATLAAHAFAHVKRARSFLRWRI